MIGQSQQHSLDFAPPGAVASATAHAPAPAAVPLAASSSASSLPLPATELWAAVQFDPGDEALTQAEREARRADLIARAHAFTPRVSFEAPDALLFELAGSRRLFGGLRALLQRLREAFPAPLSIALAPLPLAALVFARVGRARCITSRVRLASRLAPLPLLLLRWPQAELDRLRSMGVQTFGELLRLPREGVARRLGPALLAQLDRLTGRCADPRENLQPVESFIERIDPGFETRDVERLLAAFAPALERLENFLRARQRGVRALRLTFAHRYKLPSVLLLRLVAPEYRAARFAALLAARLESLTLAEPVRRIDITGGALQRLPGDSVSLWRPGEHGGGGNTETPEFLQTLMARLGERAVYGLESVPGHRPEAQWRSVWPHRSTDDAPLADDRHRPLGLLPRPEPLIARHNAGRVQGLWHEGQALQLVSGPERIESGWWDGEEIARDYYVARSGSGALLWVFRECHGPRSWFLHGCFA